MAIALRPETSVQVGYDAVVVPRTDEQTGATYYVASYPVLPGCQTDGATVEEALANLPDALELYQSMAAQAGRQLPAPRVHPGLTVTAGSTNVSELAPGGTSTGASRTLGVKVVSGSLTKVAS